MTMISINPAKAMEELSKKAGAIFGDFEKGVNFEYGSFKPRVDITEDKDNIYIYSDIPGLSKEEIKVFIDEDNKLHLKGDKKKDKKNENQVFLRTERIFGDFERTILLPDAIKKEEISAKYENGVLALTIQKVEPPLPKEIEIQIS